MSNKGIYFQIISSNKLEERSFWNETSDIYMYLRKHFMDMEFKYMISIDPYCYTMVSEVVLGEMVERVEKDLEFLIGETFSLNKLAGLNSVRLEYYDYNLILYPKSSHLDLLILNLIGFRKMLMGVKENKSYLLCFGNAWIDSKLLDFLIYLRQNKSMDDREILVNKNWTEDQIKMIQNLVKRDCLVQTEGKEIVLTEKGLVLDLAEK